MKIKNLTLEEVADIIENDLEYDKPVIEKKEKDAIVVCFRMEHGKKLLIELSDIGEAEWSAEII